MLTPSTGRTICAPHTAAGRQGGVVERLLRRPDHATGAMPGMGCICSTAAARWGGACKETAASQLGQGSRKRRSLPAARQQHSCGLAAGSITAWGCL